MNLNQQRKNSEYWKERFSILESRNNQSALEYYTNLEKQYRLAAQNIQKEMDSWFMRYAKENQITMSEARKILTGPELKDFRMTLDEYISKGKTLNYSQEWAKQLEKASTLYHVERYQALLVNIQQQIEVVTGNELDTLDKFLSDQYKTNYYQTAFEIQKGFGVGFDLMKIDDKKVANLIKQPWTLDARTFSDRIWSDKKLLVGNVDKILTQGMISGEGYVKTAKKLQDAMGTQMYKAKRIVVTESAFFSSRSQQDCFNDLGVKKYEIVSTLDGKTSEVCRHMDGKVFEQKYFKPGVTASPFHCNCRTFQAPYFDDEFETGSSRAARGADGKTYHVPANMKYPEWEKSFVNGGSKDGLDALKGGIITDKRLDEFKKLYAESDKADVEAFAQQVLRAENITAPFSYHNIDAHGQCVIDFNDLSSKVYTFELDSGDKRSFSYKAKTVFHELFHAKVDGLKSDSIKLGMTDFIDVEETFAESVSHYIAKAIGVTDDLKAAGELLGTRTDMSFSYSEKLVRNLPKLKKLDAFKDCETVADFGEVGYKFRFGAADEVTAEWAEISKHLSNTEFNLKDYSKRYSEYITENTDDLLDVMLDSLVDFRAYKKTMVDELKHALELVDSEEAFILTGNEKMLLENTLLVAMNRIGVK